MPYVTIYKTKDKKWHLGGCEILAKMDVVQREIIGSKATIPDPKPEDLCDKCFAFIKQPEEIK